MEAFDWLACDTRDQGRISIGKMLILGPSEASSQSYKKPPSSQIRGVSFSRLDSGLNFRSSIEFYKVTLSKLHS